MGFRCSGQERAHLVGSGMSEFGEDDERDPPAGLGCFHPLRAFESEAEKFLGASFAPTVSDLSGNCQRLLQAFDGLLEAIELAEDRQASLIQVDGLVELAKDAVALSETDHHPCLCQAISGRSGGSQACPVGTLPVHPVRPDKEEAQKDVRELPDEEVEAASGS